MGFLFPPDWETYYTDIQVRCAKSENAGYEIVCMQRQYLALVGVQATRQ